MNMRPNFHHQEEENFNVLEDQIVDDLYPNPDSMTYEQLLELQEKVGHVQRGFTKQQIEVILILFLKYFISYLNCLF
jgi:hypothetical protein